MQRSVSFCSHACCNFQHVLVEGALCWIAVVTTSGTLSMAPSSPLLLGSESDSQHKAQGWGDALRSVCEKCDAKVGLEG